ncbi:MAG: hypothetical protein ACNA7W_16030 [Pseudomonadales bacterium]
MATRLNQAEELSDLTKATASDVKKKGWRQIMRILQTESGGKLLVTNHDEPQAVIVSAEEYLNMQRIIGQHQTQIDDALAGLRERFDERLATLRAEEAGDRLRSVMREPARLNGEVRAGETH